MKKIKTHNKSILKIQQALLTLLVTYDLHKITVEDIIKNAGVSRGTFYKYYYDKYNVLEKIKNSVSTDLKKILITHILHSKLEKWSDDITKEVIHDVFYQKTLEIMFFFKKHSLFFSVLIKTGEVDTLLKDVTIFYTELFKITIPKSKRREHPLFHLKSSAHFMSGGLRVLIEEWLKETETTSPETVTTLILDLFCTQLHLL